MIDPGERPYDCPQCSKKFCRKVTLTKHVNREHLGLNGDGTPLRRNSQGEIVDSDIDDDDDDTQGEAPTPAPPKRPRLAARTNASAGAGRKVASKLRHVRTFRPVMVENPETGNIEPYFDENGEMMAEENVEYDADILHTPPPIFDLLGNPGLGINMGHAHLGHHGHSLHRSGHALHPIVGRAGDYLSHPSHAYSHGLAQANAQFAAQLAASGGAGPFLSPGIPYSEPAMDSYLYQHERSFSVGSGHSACSAPPIMQQQQHELYLSPTHIHSVPGLPVGVARNLVQDMEADGVPLVPLISKTEPMSPTSSIFHSPASSHASPSIARKQAMQAQYLASSGEPQVLFNAQGLPTMMINYGPEAHEPAYPQLQAAANHLTVNHHLRQAQAVQQQMYYVDGVPVLTQPAPAMSRQTFIPQAPQPVYGAAAEAVYPTPPSSSQSQFVAHFCGQPAVLDGGLLAPKMHISASHPGFQSQIWAADGAENFLEDMDEDHDGDITPQAKEHGGEPSLPISTVLVDDVDGQHHSNKQRSSSPGGVNFSFLHQNQQIAAASSGKYLQAPMLARSYSSPVVPLRYTGHTEQMDFPATPAMSYSSTFDSIYTQEDVKPQFISGSALVSGMTAAN